MSQYTITAEERAAIAVVRQKREAEYASQLQALRAAEKLAKESQRQGRPQRPAASRYCTSGICHRCHGPTSDGTRFCGECP